MKAENLCCTDSERAVNIYGYIGYLPGLEKAVKHVDELLGAFDCKGWNDDLATLVECPNKNVAEKVVCLGGQLVLAIAVCALHDEIVHVFTCDRVTQQFVVSATDVTGEK